MADSIKALKKVLRYEGVQFDTQGLPITGKTGYVNNPDDPGGETNYGITIAVARENGYTGAMKDIPFFVVQEIYRKKYMDLIRIESIPDQEIAEELLDTGINCGMGVVVNFLQRVLNVLNKKATLYPDVKVDSICGTGTISALQQALNVAPWYRLCILRALDALQCVRYISLAERDSKFETFIPGWLRNRVGI